MAEGEDLDELLAQLSGPPPPQPALAQPQLGTMMTGQELEAAMSTLKRGEMLSLPLAFDVLYQAQLGDMRIFTLLPVRSTASPFLPALGSAYAVNRKLGRDDQPPETEEGPPEAISVTFQSVLNSEVWWSHDVPGLGVAARPMGRNVRTFKKSKADEPAAARQQAESHGYRGRLYTLVARKRDESPGVAQPPQPVMPVMPPRGGGGPPPGALAPTTTQMMTMMMIPPPQAGGGQYHHPQPVTMTTTTMPLIGTTTTATAPPTTTTMPQLSTIARGLPLAATTTTTAQAAPPQQMMMMMTPTAAAAAAQSDDLPFTTTTTPPFTTTPPGESSSSVSAPSETISPRASPPRPGQPPRSGTTTGTTRPKRPRAAQREGGATQTSQDKCIAVGDVGIVQVWRPRSTGDAPAAAAAVEATTPGPQEMSGLLGDVSRFTAPPPQQQQQQQPRGPPPQQPQQPQQPPEGRYAQEPAPQDIVVNGNLRVKGDVYAEGRIYGTFVTPPQAADYAEFFPWDDDFLLDWRTSRSLGRPSKPRSHDGDRALKNSNSPKKTNSHNNKGGKTAPLFVEEDDDEQDEHHSEQDDDDSSSSSSDDDSGGGAPPPGSVVQLRAPQQALTFDTSGEGPCMVISTSPSVAAGVPAELEEAAKGALVAFVGQVPVRCRGKVKCGDQLVPSGLNDGVAVPAGRASARTRKCSTPVAFQSMRENQTLAKRYYEQTFHVVGVAMESSPPSKSPDNDDHKGGKQSRSRQQQQQKHRLAELNSKTLAEKKRLDDLKLKRASVAADDGHPENDGDGDDDDGQERLVLCLVRWDQAVKRKLHEVVDHTLVAIQGALVSRCIEASLRSCYVFVAVKLVWCVAFAASTAAKHRDDDDDDSKGVLDPVVAILSALALVTGLFAAAVVAFLVFAILRSKFPGLPFLVLFWGAFLVLVFAQIVRDDLDNPAAKRRAAPVLAYAWALLGLSYHAFVAAMLRHLKALDGAAGFAGGLAFGVAPLAGLSPTSTYTTIASKYPRRPSPSPSNKTKRSQSNASVTSSTSPTRKHHPHKRRPFPTPKPHHTSNNGGVYPHHHNAAKTTDPDSSST